MRAGVAGGVVRVDGVGCWVGGEGGGEDNQLLNQSNLSKALQSFEGTTASQRHYSQSKAL